MAKSGADYGAISVQSRGFTPKALESNGDSVRKRIENAVQRIRKNTEELRSIGLKIRTNSVVQVDLRQNINSIMRSTLEIVEQCLSHLRILRLQSNDVVTVNDVQQRVSLAINDFQRLSQEIMLSLQNTGSGSSRLRRRRKHKYRGFNASGSDSNFSDSLGHSSRYSTRMSSPEQEALISVPPITKVDFEDLETDLQAIEKVMNDIKTLSTEEDKSISVPGKAEEMICHSHSDRQIQISNRHSRGCSDESVELPPKSSKRLSTDSKRLCCCCIS